MIEIILPIITIAPGVGLVFIIICLWGLGCGLVWMGYKSGIDALGIMSFPFFAIGCVLLLSALFQPEYGMQMINITRSVP
jgi:hypothetical protein